MERETAMKILKELHNKSLFAERTALETIIPELKESKDETIRKEIIEFVDINTLSVDERHDRWIAWLEKQCYTKKDVDDAYLKGISDAKHELEKQGKQKTAVTDFNAKDWYVSKVDGKIHDMTYNPTDKVEPKFHEGEWIVWKNKCYKVNYNGCGYELIDQNDLSTSLEYGTVDTSARLYDVTKDAKDGDVVVDKSDGTIGIFESIGHHPDGGSFNDPSYCFLHCRYDDGYFFADFEDGNMMTSDDVIPAIKEQSEILFTEMKEAGYEWSDKDRKLIKIVK